MIPQNPAMNRGNDGNYIDHRAREKNLARVLTETRTYSPQVRIRLKATLKYD